MWCVSHFAGFIEVGESVYKPAEYYDNNVVKVSNLLNQMIESKIEVFHIYPRRQRLLENLLRIK